MLYNIYIGAIRDKDNNKSIWGYETYRNDRLFHHDKKLLLKYNKSDLLFYPVCSALRRIKPLPEDIVVIMTDNRLIFETINFKEKIDKTILFKKYYEKEFKHKFKNLRAAFIETRFNYYDNKMPPFVKYYNLIEKLEKHRHLIDMD